MQIAALNVRSEADAIAKRLSVEGLRGVRAGAGQRHAVGVPRPRRQVQDAARSRDGRGEAAKRRAVQALGYALAARLGRPARAQLSPSSVIPRSRWIALAPLLVALSVRRTAPLDARVLPRPRRPASSTSPARSTGSRDVMAVYGGLPSPVAVLVNALLVAYLALFPALFARGRAPAACSATGRARCWRRRSCGWRPSWGGRICSTGFPWVLLGYSQATVLPIAQLASVFGVYGVSALVATRQRGAGASCASARADATLPARAGRVGRWRSCCVVVGVAVWGSRRAAASGVDARGRAGPRRARAGQRRSGARSGIRARAARSSRTTCA